MADTISLSSTTAVTLSNSADNPVTITDTGTIDPAGGIALSLLAPIEWTVDNYGLLEVTGASGDGLRLGAGGTIDNKAGGSIVGAAYGAFIFGAGSVTNAGLIQSKGTSGIALTLIGGTVGNSATITGGQGIHIGTSAGVVTNSGLISGYADGIDLASGTVSNLAGGVITSTNTAAVQLGGSAFVTNAASATIAGGWGIIDTLGVAIIDNAGLISGSTFDGEGIFLAGGTVSNASSGTISGNFYAVSFESGTPTLLNAGMITTVRSVAIATTFGGPGIAYVGNTGSIIGAGGGVRLEGWVGSVHNSGLIDGSNSYGVRLDSGGNVTNAAGGIIRAGGVGVYIGGGGATGAGGGTVINAGTIAATNTTLTDDAVYLKAGYADRLIADTGAVFVGKLNGGNPFGATVASVLELATGAGTIATFITNFDSIVFDPGAAWKISSSPLALADGELISGFSPGNTIELAGTTVSKTALSGDTLQLTGGLNVILPGNTFSYAQFSVTNAGGNTDITVACFVAGTHILTDAGEVAVEALHPGMRVVSLTHHRPIAAKWIGARAVAGAAPVRIAAGAFGEGLPHRELWLSPDHAVFVDGALIPVRYLVNGASIAQITCNEINYFHVELEAHAVLLADGLPAESYLDTGNRAALRGVNFRYAM